MKIYAADKSELMQVTRVERQGDNLVLKGKVFGTMPMAATLTPEEARNFRKLLTPRLAWFLITLPFRKSKVPPTLAIASAAKQSRAARSSPGLLRRSASRDDVTLEKSAMTLRNEGNAIVVTGAAGAIGFATCEILYREGAELVLVDVDEEGLKARMEQLAGMRDPARRQTV